MKIEFVKTLLVYSAVVLLASMLLMVVIIPDVYNQTIPGSKNMGAVVGISLAFLVRLVILICSIRVIRRFASKSSNRKAILIICGILLLLFSLIYMDGAFAFLNDTHIIYVSCLMFASVFLDVIASILILIVASKKFDR